MSTARKFAPLFVLLALLAACKPAVPATGSPEAGYDIRFVVLGEGVEDRYLVRDIDCTVVAYADGRPVLIIDTAGGQGVNQLNFHVRTNPHEAPEVRILDQAGADTIEFICTMAGQAGDSLDCATTVAGTGRIAPLLGAQEFDLIEQKGGGVAICSGTINLRA